MSRPDLATLGALRAAGHGPRTLRQEIRANLLAKLEAGEALFPASSATTTR